jgi:hypothetical protein
MQAARLLDRMGFSSLYAKGRPHVPALRVCAIVSPDTLLKTTAVRV